MESCHKIVFRGQVHRSKVALKQIARMLAKSGCCVDSQLVKGRSFFFRRNRLPVLTGGSWYLGHVELAARFQLCHFIRSLGTSFITA